MPRKRATPVKPIALRIPEGWREKIEAAARLIDRPPTYWIGVAARTAIGHYAGKPKALQTALNQFYRVGPDPETLNLELPADLVASIRGTTAEAGATGGSSPGQFLRLAIARGLGLI